MPRTPRVAFAGAVYHVATRAVSGQYAFTRDGDRRRFLADLDRTVRRYHWRVHTYCVMGTHYHLVVQTMEPTISQGAQYLNGRYAQWFDREHEREGHLWGRRFFAELIVRESQLLETCRYVVRNPVRAGLCADPLDWPWSSHQAMAGLAPAPPFLTRTWLLGHFDRDPRRACEAYASFVAAGALRSSAPATAPPTRAVALAR